MKKVNMHVAQCCAPQNSFETANKEIHQIFKLLYHRNFHRNRYYITIEMTTLKCIDDLNAETGSENTRFEDTTEKNILEIINEN